MPEDTIPNPVDDTDARDAQPNESTTDQTTDEQADELGEKGQAALKAERDARRKAEREAKALAARVAEFENANKSDAEKTAAALDAATKRADAAEQRLRDANARVAVTEAAQKVNAISVRAVLKLIEDDLDYDDEGEPTNVDALIAQARKDEPSLFRHAGGSADGGKTGTTTPEAQPGIDRIRQAYATSSTSARRR